MACAQRLDLGNRGAGGRLVIRIIGLRAEGLRHRLNGNEGQRAVDELDCSGGPRCRIIVAGAGMNGLAVERAEMTDKAGIEMMCVSAVAIAAGCAGIVQIGTRAIDLDGDGVALHPIDIAPPIEAVREDRQASRAEGLVETKAGNVVAARDVDAAIPSLSQGFPLVAA